jgi:hypothetical protein
LALQDPPDPQQSPPQSDLRVSASEARVTQPVVPPPTKSTEKELEFWHAQRTQKAEQGWVGWVFGSKYEKPGNIAAIVVLLSFFFLFWSFYHLYTPTILPETFFKVLAAFMGVIGLALGYLFGSSHRP